MPDDPIDGLATAELVRTRQISAEEAVRSAIERIEAANPALNAVIADVFERALAEAAAPTLPSGPFSGVPLLLKDIGATQQGLPQYSGNRALLALGHRAPDDTPVGARFRQAGFVVTGITNTSEFGAQPTTQPLAFGPTRNPWALDRSAGGSSGGSAAAVAAGMVPIAHGSDIAGSIRMPSGWCGVVGLKPSRGRVPLGPLIARDLTEHVITRTVRDSAAVLDALHGAGSAELFGAPAPAGPFARAVETSPATLRIGVLTQVDATGVTVAPACVEAAEGCGALLASLGHQVQDGGPERLFDDEFVANWSGITAARLKRLLEAFAVTLGRAPTEADVEPYQLALAATGEMTGSELLARQEWQQLHAARIGAWWDAGFDLLVTPTTGEPAVPLEALVPPPTAPLELLPRFLGIQCFAIPFSVTGQPAISLPLHWTEDGLPVGVQVIARHGREDLLLRVAAQLEGARPWAGRRPPSP